MNRRDFVRCGGLVVIGLLAAGGTARAQEVDTAYYYRLTNQLVPRPEPLAGHVQRRRQQAFMGKTGNYAGQRWNLTPLGDGTYRLTNSFLGESRPQDTYSDGENAPFRGRTGNYTGQRWRLVPLGDGTYRLQNAFLGTSRALDTYSAGENKPFLGKTDKDYSGQHWGLRRVKPI